MTFSQRAVEAAARACYEHEPRTHFDEVVRWSDIGSGTQDRYRHKARLALTAALAVDGVAPQGWQEIESAPHDANVLLGWRDWRDHAWCTEVGAASHGWRRNGVSTMSRHGSATHWMPLPQPPAASDGEGRK